MLQGDGVRLRAIIPEDVEVLWGYWSDIDVVSLASSDPPRPLTLAEAKTFFDEAAKKNDLMRFAIEADVQVVGDCVIHSIDKHNRRCEVGIILGKPHWAKGYGQRALRLLVDFAFQHNNMHRVGLEVLADDERAVGCYRKVGFVEEGRLRQRDWVNGAYHDVMVMGILEEDWRFRS